MRSYSKFNQKQQEAIFHDHMRHGPLLVIAGAGSGKTSVLTARMEYLMEQGVPSSEILALTFTVKAAGEMRERLLEAVPDSVANLSTFHSLAYQLLLNEKDGVANFTRLGFKEKPQIQEWKEREWIAFLWQ